MTKQAPIVIAPRANRIYEKSVCQANIFSACQANAFRDCRNNAGKLFVGVIAEIMSSRSG
jgi:hypothetical protein